MKVWKKYKEYLFWGEWHIHTSLTDGSDDIAAYAKKAKELGIPLLAFTEHVRRDLSYDFSFFLSEIERVREQYPDLVILSGCETKVLKDGTVDCMPDILKKVDLRCFAFHSFPGVRHNYLTALQRVIDACDVDVWVHPGLFFRKHGMLSLTDKELDIIFSKMRLKNIILEFNFKYKLPTIEWIKRYFAFKPRPVMIWGGDIHSCEDLEQSWGSKKRYKNQWGDFL